MAKNSIIELQVINYVVEHKNTHFLREENISPSQFTDTYGKILEYIFEHEKKYEVVPDATTLASMFPDYTPVEVTDSPVFLIDKLKQFIAYRSFGADFNSMRADLEEGDVQQALRKLKEQIEKNLQVFNKASEGTDITTDHSRKESYVRKVNGDGDVVYEIGIPTIDEQFGGILKDDLTVVFARLNQGKSYMLTYIAHNMHRQGLKVLFYSGEMTAEAVAYRYDSISDSYSNKALTFGKPNLGDGKSVGTYTDYLNGLRDKQCFFNIVEPKDFGGRFATVDDIEYLMDEMKPDVVFLDQLSLMVDSSATKSTTDRAKYEHIMTNLKRISGTHSIPIFVAVQASRQAAERNEEGEFELPEMHHIAESDAIGQHCSRAISLCTNKDEETNGHIMKVGIMKNRNGGYVDFKMKVDFEFGNFEELRQMTLRSENSF